MPMKEMQIQSLGQEDALEEEMATHFSILTWKVPWTEEPGGLQYMGLQRVRHNWTENILYLGFSVIATAAASTTTSRL